MNKELIEKIVREKFSFETDYGIKTKVSQVIVDDGPLTSISVVFNRFNFIDLEKLNQLAASFRSVKTQIFAAENLTLSVTFYCE
jgi:translation elongation factor P/translation initiation factor 5A